MTGVAVTDAPLDAVRCGVVQDLRRIDLFRELDERTLAELGRVARRRVYAEGETIAEPERTRGSVFAVADGIVRVYRMASAEQGVHLATFRAGNAFEFLGCDEHGAPRSVAEARADRTVIYRIPRPHMQRLLDDHPCVARAALAAARLYLADAWDRIEERDLCDVETRLARVLATLAAEHPRRVVRETQAELGRLAATGREEVNKKLQRFRARGWISMRAGQRGIVVCDREALTALRDDARRQRP